MNYIRAYGSDWARDFTGLVEFLTPFLPEDALAHHVGSTSIPNMPAKDIVDVDIECGPGGMVDIINSLRKAGYAHAGDQGIPSREAFHPLKGTNASKLRPHHLYACESNSPELARHLAFRDYLLAHPDRADWLANKKIQADAEATSRDAYIENKSVSYAEIVKEAMTWSGQIGDKKIDR